jgi:hypothetical protein
MQFFGHEEMDNRDGIAQFLGKREVAGAKQPPNYASRDSTYL